MTDAEFLRAFEAATLPRPEWTHAAHLRMAYLYLRDLPYPDALAAVRGGIRAYNAAQGNHTGYHETVTVAFARLVAGRLRPDPAPTFAAFEAAHPDLFENGVRVLLGYYGYPVWKDPEARERFVEPEFAPLPPEPPPAPPLTGAGGPEPGCCRTTGRPTG